jgi:cysteine-rich repeat protein
MKRFFVLGFLLGAMIFGSALFGVSALYADEVNVGLTVPAYCGNGVAEDPEPCDGSDLGGHTCITEGFDSGTLTCSGVCVVVTTACVRDTPCTGCNTQTCGNTQREGTEACDDGNASNSDVCLTSCVLATCGDGYVRTDVEDCDDGNADNTDACLNTCEDSSCGDDIVQLILGETCDTGVSRGECPATCSLSCSRNDCPICGDGEKEGDEECDDKNSINTDACLNTCKSARCGDGQVQEGVEDCDDGNTSNVDACLNTCKFSCGDGSCVSPESNSSCPVDCPPPYEEVCGNNFCGVGEDCNLCEVDCDRCIPGGSCGDGACNESETTDSCCRDCGGCGPGGGSCPDGTCDSNESCSICEADCGKCIVIENPIITPPVINPVVEEVVKEIYNFIKENEFVQEQVKKVEDATKQIIQTIQNVANIEQVENVTKNIVAPAVVITSAAVITPSLLSILIPLLRFLFFQPLLLLGRRKRKEWGIVYNSVTKLPVDLAMVRLIDAVTNRIVQSRVTDAQGRYLFIVKPGSYILEITKPGLVYPSVLLAGVKADGSIPDLYHGEKIEVTGEDTLVTPNIPVDPVDAKVKSVKRIAWEKFARVFQHVISIIGIVATLIALYISSVWYVWVFLGIHLVLYAMFLRFIIPKKPKGWGIVYDKEEKKPLGKVIARLFNKDYDKLISSQTTDSKGRYAFLVGPSNYYVTFEKTGYKQGKSRDIVIKGAEDVVTEENILLEKNKGEGADLTSPVVPPSAVTPPAIVPSPVEQALPPIEPTPAPEAEKEESSEEKKEGLFG